MSFGRKRGESSNQRSNKRQREEIEDPNQAVIGSQASTATDTATMLSPFSSQTYHRNTESLAIKLNQLKEKSARYAKHPRKRYYINENSKILTT